MFYILLAFLLGCVNVFSKTVNYQATVHMGTFNGTLVNYVTASLLSLALMAWMEPSLMDTGHFASAPAWLYLGGVFGVIALLINVVSLKKINLFQSTALLLVGQLAGSALLDAVLFHTMSAVKLLGVTAVAVGVVWDKKVSLTGASSSD